MPKYVALDLETEQIHKMPDGKIHGVFFCGEDYHPWGLPWGDDALTEISILVNDSDTVFVMHNASFDWGVLKHKGINIPLSRIVDTMTLVHAVNPRRGAYSLESLGETVGFPKIDYEQALRDAGLWNGHKDDKGFYDLPWNPCMERYGKRDVEITMCVWHKYHQHLEADPRLSQNYYDIRVPFTETLVSMQQGMHVDLDHTVKTAGAICASVNQLQMEFLAKYPRAVELKWNATTKKYVPQPREHTPNLQSPNDVASLLFQHGWEPDEYKRDTGRPITSQAVLQRLVADIKTEPRLKELAVAISEIRSQLGITGQLLQILKLVDKSSGMLRGSWHDTGTVTTRLSSSAPNMQNLSTRHRVWGKEVRKCFTPPPDYDMLCGDLSQIELAIVAWYLEVVRGDSRAAEGNRQGKDAHDTNTQLWYNVSKDDPEFKALRAKAKNGAFATNYSASAHRLGLTLNISTKEAQEIIDTVNDNSDIQPLKEFVWEQMAQSRDVLPVEKPYGFGSTNKGFLYTVFNGRMFYPEIVSSDKASRAKAQRQSFNALCQGGCAVLLRHLCNLSIPAFRNGEGWIAGLVHDEMLAYVKKEHTEQVLSHLNRVWNSIVLPSDQGGVFVRADFHVVQSWADK